MTTSSCDRDSPLSMASTIECYVKRVTVPVVHLTFVALYVGIGHILDIAGGIATVAEHRDPLSIHM